MAKQFDNSITTFSRPAGNTTLLIGGSVIGVLLAASIVLSVIYAIWPLAILLGLGLVGFAAFFWIAFDQSRVLAAWRSGTRVDWDSTGPEIQRQSLGIEVTELAGILEVEPESISDLQSAYIVAEDLALRQMQQEEGIPLLRHVSVHGVPFDAAFVSDKRLVCCEVAFLVTPELRQDRREAIMRKAGLVRRALETRNSPLDVRLMLVLVTQLTAEDERHLRSTIGSAAFRGTPVNIEVRFVDFEALQRIYVTEQ